MKKNEINSYNLLNKAIGNLGDIKTYFLNGVEEEPYKNALDEVKSIIDKAFEEFTKKSRTRDEILADIKSMVREEDVLVAIAEIYDSGYELYTNIDDLYSYPSELVEAMYNDDREPYDVYCSEYFIKCADILYCYGDKHEFWCDLVDWDTDREIYYEISNGHTDRYRGHFDELDELLDELDECEE